MVHHSQNDCCRQSTTPLIGLTSSEPIVAIATAVGRGSVGVIRISGDGLDLFYEALTRGHPIKPRYANYLPLYDSDGSLIDEVIVIFFRGPHSYTGQDVVEIQGHGGLAVTQLLLKRCLIVGQFIGLRLAKPGEFTLRAFLNDKIDLAQAEAVSDMIEASSTAAAKAAAASLSGVFSKEIKKLADDILLVRTLVEATLDFPEEEIDFIEKYEIKSKLDSIHTQLSHTLLLSKQSSALKEGLKVVLAGEPNVGKSSLLNAIFSEDLAIVTDIPGTTRDTLRESFMIDGIPVTITDTAGLRNATDPIEKLGIERTWGAVSQADLILDIIDVRDPRSFLKTWRDRTELTSKPIITVFNKCDLLTNEAIKPAKHQTSVFVSAKTGSGLDQLKELIVKQTGRELGDLSPWLGRQRHIEAMNRAIEHLAIAMQHASFNDQVLDLVAEELRLTHIELGSITGEVTADDLLGNIFSNFCIGK